MCSWPQTMNPMVKMSTPGCSVRDSHAAQKKKALLFFSLRTGLAPCSRKADLGTERRSCQGGPTQIAKLVEQAKPQG